MANPTTNYGWPMPTSTDLVTDLPADFAAFGQPVDTSLKALNPETTLGDLAYRSATANTNTRLPIGTTGQVLSVVGGVPAWQNGTTGDIEGVTAGVGISGGGTSGTVTVTNSMATAITTAGDLIKGTGSGTFDRLGIGTTGQVLTVSSGAPAWATPAGGSWSQAATGSLTGSSVTISSLTGKQYYVFLKQVSHSASSEYVQVRFNGDTGTNYWRADSDGAVSNLYTTGSGTFAGAETPSFGIHVDMADTSMAFKPVQNMTPKSSNGSVSGWYGSSSAITSITLFPSGGTFDAGTYYVWSFA